MESKREWNRLHAEHLKLLIEPVWNRNWIGTPIEVTVSGGLLIEPVWNRNGLGSYST